jgi:hypothetical protein
MSRPHPARRSASADRAFLPTPHGKRSSYAFDDLAETLGEAFVSKATSAEAWDDAEPDLDAVLRTAPWLE